MLPLKVSKSEEAIELQQPREFGCNHLLREFDSCCQLVVPWVRFVGPYVLQCCTVKFSLQQTLRSLSTRFLVRKSNGF